MSVLLDTLDMFFICGLETSDDYASYRVGAVPLAIQLTADRRHEVELQ